MQAQERPATLILTVTSGLRLSRARHVYNRDAETGNWNWFCSATKNDQNVKNVSITTVCHMGSKASVTPAQLIKNPAIVENFFFFHRNELELGTYINLYLFESSIERPSRDIFTFRLSNCQTAEQAEPTEQAKPAEPTLCKNLFTNPDFEAI